MSVKNVRSPKQWEALSAIMDFNGKTVLDVGCGHGDLLVFAKDAGADVVGVDHNLDVVRLARKRGLPIAWLDIVRFLRGKRDGQYDIAFCFSVLPYVDEHEVLKVLARVADVVFIEAQLLGDGPGIYYNEEELRGALLEYWNNVTRIGETKVKIRNTVRAIWMCEGRKEMGDSMGAIL